MDLPEYLTVEQVADRLQISRSLVYRYIQDGELATYKFGKVRRVTTDELKRFVEGHTERRSD